jgi:tetratricopeptide (TPR) repeat protein
MKKKISSVRNQKDGIKASTESRLKRFLGPYLKKLFTGFLFLSILTVGGISLNSFQHWKADKAMNLFNEGTDEKSFSEVIKQYPDTQAAKLALLKVIELQWNSKNYAEVEKNCQAFLKRYPKDLFAPFLKNLLGEAYLEEKKLNEAESLYASFMKEDTGAYLFPLAQINLARVYMTRNETEKAKSFLSKIQNDPSFQFWNDNIEAMIRRENRQN